MGTYLNPGNVLFCECLNSDIYVDKTELIRYTNSFLATERKFVCVSRPRRFGKSMSLKMLSAYYSKNCDSREIFEKLKIGQADSSSKALIFEKGLNKYDTLLIDMQGVLDNVVNDPQVQQELELFCRKWPDLSPAVQQNINHPILLAVQREIILNIRKNNEYAVYIPENESFLGNALLDIYRNTGNQFVLLIDEWDCIFRNFEDDKILQDKYINLLRALFKNMGLLPVYALVYMTGILPIKRYGTQSALNNFREYTMLEMSPLEEFTGFTEEETMALYVKYGMDTQKAREWYDGYQLDEFGHIFNPNSVVESVIRRKFKNFWTATGTYESIRKLINMDFDGLKEKVITMLGGGKCKVNVTKFQNDMVTFSNCDDVLTLLIHLGYLGYDSSQNEVYIPNKEIRDEFVNAIEDDKWTPTYTAIARSKELLEATLACEDVTVASCIEKVHEDNTAILTYNNENALSCVIQLAYFQAQDDYMLIREMPAGKGFADIAFIPRKGVNKPALIVELKWNKSTLSALDQIREKHYSEQLREYFGEVLLVGINYNKNSKDKKHTCKIERICKQKPISPII